MDVTIWDVMTAVCTLATALLALVIYFEQKRRNRADLLEQSFDILQKLNEKALESDENIEAALKSGNPNDMTSVIEGRIIYFHYMRINRMFRAYEYHRRKYLSEYERDRIIDSYLGTLKPIPEDQLRAMLRRGYPPEFAADLMQWVKNAELLPVITGPTKNDD